MGYDPILGPPRFELEKLDSSSVLLMHDIMGFSCLWFSIPILGFLAATSMGKLGRHSAVETAAFLCVFLFNTTFWSFMGDYFASAYAEAPTEEVQVAWWEKMMVFNKIDNVFAKLSVYGSLAIYVIQLAT